MSSYSQQPRKPYQPLRKGDSKKWKRVIILGSLVVTLGLIATAWQGPIFRQVTFCDRVEGKGNVREALVILDASDPWSQLREQQVKDDLLQSLKVHRWVSVYEVGSGVDDNREPELLYEGCNPGTRDSFVEEYGRYPWGAQTDQLEPKYEEFRAAIESEVSRVAQKTAIDNSPIMETLQWAATNGNLVANHKLATDMLPPGLEVLLVSDLLANSPEYTVYGGSPDLSDSRARQLAGAGQLGIEELEGAEVTLLYLATDMLPPGVSSPQLRAFWQKFLECQGRGQLGCLSGGSSEGATIVEMIPVGGG
jgi:hypothetical protein